ncbi:isochorismatase family protein, partial [Bacillus licheniformis]
AIGATRGPLLGAALGLSRIAARLVGPSVDTIKQISLFAWIPLISVWCGLGDVAKVVFLPLAALLPELAIDTVRDIVFDKTRPSCFAGTRLAAWLHAAGIGEIVIAGMKTQYCVDTTCRAAADLGFRAVL